MIHFCGVGIGDGLQLAAVLKRTPGRHKVFTESKYVAEVLSTIKHLEVVSGPATNDDIAYGRWESDREPLRLATEDFDLPGVMFMPTPYTVVQPATTFHSVRCPKLPALERTTVAIGREEDLGAPYAATLDLRGKLPLPAALAVVLGAEDAIGIDSWVALLAGLLGKPSVMYTDQRVTYELLGAHYAVFMPSIRMEFVG